MAWDIKTCLAITAVLVAPLGAEDLSSKITVLIYNYAAIPSETLAKTEAEAARIYQHSGIKIQWAHSPLSPAEVGQFPGCTLSPWPTWLVLRILSQPMAEGLRRAQDSFGFAIAEDGFAIIANVFAHDAEQLSNSSGMPVEVMLGHVIAHELGHLLLGPLSHGSTGIMQCPWRKKELENVARGFMMFTPGEAKRMRANIRARMSKSETGGAHISNRSFE
jgi:hypothetical protein